MNLYPFWIKLKPGILRALIPIQHSSGGHRSFTSSRCSMPVCQFGMTNAQFGMTNAPMSHEEAWDPKNYGINKDGCCDCPGGPCENCAGCDPPQWHKNGEGWRHCNKVAKGRGQWYHYLFLSTEAATELTPEGSTRVQSQTGRVFCSNLSLIHI